MPEHVFDSHEAARDQACESVGFMASKKIQVGGEVFEIPHPSLLDDEQEERYSQLQLDMELSEELDRWPDTKDDDGNVTRRGAPKEPLRTKDGQLVEGYNTRLAKAILGPRRFKQFLAAGGRSSDIMLYWTEMQQALADRRAKDPKSGRSSTGLAAVPDTDRS